MPMQVDWQRGTIAGTLQASDLPGVDGPVHTLWRGEIVDCQNHHFTSGHLGQTAAGDLRCWQRFPGFLQLGCHSGEHLAAVTRAAVERTGWIFMRWKEQSFLSHGAEAAAARHGAGGLLSINGFYYVGYERATGIATAFYHDPSLHALQRLVLRSGAQPGGGRTFGADA